MWLAVLWFGVVCLGAPLPWVVFCGAVLSSGGVLSCSAVCFRRCLCLLFFFLPLRFLLSVSWCASLWLVGLLWRPAPLCCVLLCCPVVWC